MPVELRRIFSDLFLVTFACAVLSYYVNFQWQQKLDLSSTLYIGGVSLLLMELQPQREREPILWINITSMALDLCQNLILQYLAVQYPWTFCCYLTNHLLPDMASSYLSRLLMTMIFFGYALYRRIKQLEASKPKIQPRKYRVDMLFAEKFSS